MIESKVSETAAEAVLGLSFDKEERTSQSQTLVTPMM